MYESRKNKKIYNFEQREYYLLTTRSTDVLKIYMLHFKLLVRCTCEIIHTIFKILFYTQQ
jgi:hypothetical protein